MKKTIFSRETVRIYYGDAKLRNFLSYMGNKIKNETGLKIRCEQKELKDNTVIISDREISLPAGNLKGAEKAKKVKLSKYDSFLIDAHETSILISSLSYSGLLNGLIKFFRQFKMSSAEGKNICIRETYSCPAVKNRFYHICMSGSTPNIESFLELIRTIKLFGYNGIVIEFENKFPYTKNNSFLHPDHYLLEDIKKIRETAVNFGVQVIPLLQCLGHLEYLLKYDEFKDLCEVEGHIRDACPLNEWTFEIFKQFSEEILEQFPETKYFHIGADEVRILGECPKCKKYEGKHGNYSTFTAYVKKVTDHLLAKGIQPMMWDDIIYRHYPDVKITGLSEKTIIVNWDYWTINSQKSAELIYTLGKTGITVSKKHLLEIEKFLLEEQDGVKVKFEATGLFENYDWKNLKIYDFIKTKDFPASVKAFPVIEMIKKDGFIPAGASNVRKSLDGIDSQNFIHRVQNNKAWGEKLKASGVDFFIATSWSRGNSLREPVFNMELMLYPLASGGYFSWNGGGSIEEFNVFFENWISSAKENVKLTMSIYEMFKGLSAIVSPAFNELLKENLVVLKKSKTPFYEMLYLYIRVFVFNREYNGFIRILRNILYRIEMEHDYPEKEKRQHLERLEELRKEIESIEKESEKIIKKYVLPADAKELTISLFYYKKKELEGFIGAVK
ncbi:MAG: hypothetical protein A2017_21780 [Lentisphaerae bacterium GWF2_44_16]|nr:MAG: hypothetical protein A2017_21780 [Lentisphaerae bacterium GWF2_44_16]